jgi:hypothetical protein
MTNEKNTLKATSKKVQKDILAVSHDINVIATSASIKPHCQAHWMKTSLGECGIEDLICEILEENGSPMSILQVNREVRNKFTNNTTRYQLQTIRNYMSIKMIRNDKLCKIKLSKTESDCHCSDNGLPIAKKPCNLYKLALRITTIVWE